VPHATIVPGAIYNTVLVLGINEDKWNSLRPEDRDAITRISGEAFAKGIGRAYANGDKAAFELMRKAGKPAEVFPAAALVDLKKILLPIERDWIEKAKKKGMADPQKVLDQLRADIAAVK
jgi:TRAP-type C4-dicarboxylate transport system substrate-binding protein